MRSGSPRPRGYGYANKASDRWGLLYMLMNHKPQRLNGFIRTRCAT